jgi:hypothetical protein
MRRWLPALAAGCFSPSPPRGLPCTSWCPPPEKCINDVCALASTGGDGGTIDANYMFVTSDKKAPQDFGGVAGADVWCNQRASTAGLPGTYRAWLTDFSAEDARTRLAEKNARGWYRVDGMPFTDRVTDLASNNAETLVWYPPRLDEHGNDLGPADDTAVATGTWLDGTSDFLGQDCNGFTGNTLGVNGVLDGGRVSWTQDDVNASCTTPAHVYCFGVDKNVVVPPPVAPADTRLAFIAVAAVGGGISGLDATCQSAAQANGATGTFIAWIATTSSSASSRFSGTTPWRRRDNLVVLTAQLEMLAGIDQRLDGIGAEGSVWTGAKLPDAVAASPGDTCNDWTSTSGNGIVGTPGRSLIAHAFDSGTQTCGQTAYIYCLEQ